MLRLHIGLFCFATSGARTMASHARDVNSFCEIFFPLCPPPFPPAFARVTTRARDVSTAGGRVISSPTRSRAQKVARSRHRRRRHRARPRPRRRRHRRRRARARGDGRRHGARAALSLASRAQMSTDASRGPRVRLLVDETRAIGETKPSESDARGSVPLETPLETLEEDELVVELVGPSAFE